MRFSSPRERRLWMWTAAVVTAIYSTLGLARILSNELRDRQLFDSAFFVGMFSIGIALVALALRKRVSEIEIGVGLAVAAVYVLIFARMGIPEERTHLIEYGVVALLLYEALDERRRNGRLEHSPALLAMLGAAIVGTLDEGIQALLPSRVFDIRDIVFNALAAVLAVLARVAIARVGQGKQT